MSVEFGAFYQDGILYIEAFDKDNFAPLPMGVITARPQDLEHPTNQEENAFRQQVTQAIQAIAIQFAEATLHYQGPSRNQGGNQFWRRRIGIRNQGMTTWALFIWNEIQAICQACTVQFQQKAKTSKAKTRVAVRNHPNTFHNYNNSLKYVCRLYIRNNLTAAQRHCYAAALKMGNTEKGYQNFVRQLLTHNHRATGQPLTRQAKLLIEQEVAQIPFAA